MNTLKKTLALVATLAMASTAFVGCGKDDSSSESKADDTKATDAATEATDAPAATDAPEATDAPTEAPTDAPAASGAANSTEVGEVKLKTGGDTFTVVAWNPDDVPALIEAWTAATGYDASKVNFINMDCGGGDAAEKYDNLFKSGDDLDVFFCEADWALRYINDDTKTAALEDLGFTDANFADQFAYTQEIGRATDGANAGKMVGTSWQAAPGGWCYRTDLADTYLGVKSPEDMQAKVSDWDAFQATAAEVATASGNKTALTTTLGGIWQAFAANRSTPWVVDNKLTVDDFCDTFINLAKNMRDNGYVTEANQWTDEWYAAGQTDDTMGYFVSTWGFGVSILETAAGGEGGATYGKWNVCQGPTPYFWGGTWACVSPKTDNADLVASFMHYFTVDEASMKEYALAKPDYVNNMNAMQAIVDEGTNSNPLLGGQDQFSVLHAAAQNINLNGLITPYDSAIKTAFLDAVNAYCAGETADAAACLDDFKNRVAESVTDITVE